MENEYRIFVVEDDPWFSDVLEYMLKKEAGCQVEVFRTGQDCLDNLHRRPTLITLDHNLKGINGMEVLQQVKAFDAGIPVVVISGLQDVRRAVQLLRAGATDYIVKGEEGNERLLSTVRNVLEKEALRREVIGLREEMTQRYDFANLVGTSPQIQKVKQRMAKALDNNITVSISGETGTGKEVVAKGIHYNSKRRKKPFVAVNVAAIPAELIESELFGFEKGAFTGAETARKGRFEEANGGTLFLDEIGEMPLPTQAKILRAIQEREISPIGSNETRKINVRLLVSTHRSLAEEVKNGNFREDLYYRLLGLPIEVPPLRDRGNDILMLANHFVSAFAKANELGSISISEDARKKLFRHSFPGNVRELKAHMELAAVMCTNKVIEPQDLNFVIGGDLASLLVNEKTLREYTEEIVMHFLRKYDNNVLLVADKLGIGKSTIYRMLNRMKTQSPDAG